jgi:prophage antirepressor-like protein
MSAITLFNFEGTQVRVSMDEKGEPWFVAKDVVAVLGSEWSGAAVQSVPERWKGVISVITPGGNQSVVALSESGLNFYVMRSDKPKALPFQEWLAGEVLPSIRKTGSYSREPVQVQQYAIKSDAESQACIIRDTALFLQQLVPTIRPEMAAACTLRALTSSGLMAKPAHEDLRNMLSVDWDKAPSLTPTEIGQKLGGVKPTLVNKMLESRGLQKKSGKKWEPTEDGKAYAGAVAYQAEHSEHKGVQLKWAPEVVDVLMQDSDDIELPVKTKLLV